MTVRATLFDPNCGLLADHFLQSERHPAAARAARRRSLVRAIQEAVEGWFDDAPKPCENCNGRGTFDNTAHVLVCKSCHGCGTIPRVLP